MEYTVILNGESIDLPNYSIKISEKLEKVEISNLSNKDFKSKCKVMYDFIVEIIGKENTIKFIGKFEDSDPNSINILYLKIVESYNRPLNDFQKSQSEEKIDTEQMDKVIELLKALPNAELIKKINK